MIASDTPWRARPLDVLAAAVAQALDGQAALIATHDADATRVAGAEGLAASSVATLAGPLAEIQAAVRQPEPVRVDSLASSLLPGARALADLGFAAALVAPAALAGTQVGLVMALYDDRGCVGDLDLAGVISRHVALVLVSGAQSAEPEDLLPAMTSLPQLAYVVDRVLARRLGARRAGISLWEPDTRRLRLVSGSFGAGEDVASASVLTYGEIAGARGEGGPPPAGWPERLGITRLVSLPLYAGDRRVGALHLADPPDDWTADRRAAADELALKVAPVAEHLAAVARIEARQRLEEVIAAAATAFASGQPLVGILPSALEELRTAIGAAMVCYAPDGEAALVAAEAGVERPAIAAFERETAAACAPRDRALGARGGDHADAARMFSSLRLGGLRVGAVGAVRSNPRPFSHDESAAVARLGGLVCLARAMEHYQAQRTELARLQERQRIAEDLHDEVAQLLFAAVLNLDSALEQELDPHLAEPLAQARSLLTRGDSAIRSVMERLQVRPAPGGR